MHATHSSSAHVTTTHHDARELSAFEASLVSGGSWGAAFFCGALGFVEGGPVGGVVGLIVGAVGD